MKSIYYDKYTHILHIGKIMMTLVPQWGLYFTRVDASKSPFLKVGRLIIRF